MSWLGERLGAEQFGVTAGITQFNQRPLFEPFHLALGTCWAWIDCDHPDAALKTVRPERFGESNEGSVRGGASDAVKRRALAGDTDDIDDDAAAARAHRPIKRSRKVKITE